MKKHSVNRREFLVRTSLGAIGAAASLQSSGFAQALPQPAKPALLGGMPIREDRSWPSWPLWNSDDENKVIEVLRTRKWSRGKYVKQFESEFSELMGSKRCLATTNGTNALYVSLKGLDIGIGDEVLVNPFTFIATIDAIMIAGALPIFVDTEPDTFSMDPAKLEEKITPNTRAILPVHIGGAPADMDAIPAIAKNHNLKVIEDACQAHFAEWNHKKVGSIGDTGCFSFQTSKNYTSGEGGAILSNDDYLMDWCLSFHDFGRPHGQIKGRGYPILGTKCRMAEYQAAILLAQKQRILEADQKRTENGDYLTKRLAEVPFITPRKRLPQITRMAYYDLFCRYHKEKCENISLETIIKALMAEGIDCSEGPPDQNKDTFFEKTLSSKDFQRAYSKQQIDFCRQMNHCPVNDRLTQEILRFSGWLFLADQKDVDDIINALMKIYEHRKDLAKFDADQQKK